MPYRFVRSSEFIAEYLKSHPSKDGMLWIELLAEAVNASSAVVVSVGYDAMGEPMTMLLKDGASHEPPDLGGGQPRSDRRGR